MAANSPPEWNLPNQVGAIGQAYSLDLNDASEDQDGHPGTFSKVSGNVPGLALVGSIYSGTPTTAGTNTVVFRRSDGFTGTNVSADFVISDPDVTAPTAPVLGATADGSTVDFTLVTPSTDASGIKKYRLFRGGAFQFDILSFTPTPEQVGVPDGTYNYHLTAVDNSANLNESAPSNTVQVVVQVTPPVPDVPVNSPVTSITSTTATANWTPGPNGPTPTSYEILVGDGDGNGNQVGNGSIVGTATHPDLDFGITGLTAGQEYYVRVRAYNGASPPSAYSPRLFFTASTSGGSGTFLFQAKFDSLTAGRCIFEMPGGYTPECQAKFPQDEATNPEGWLQQHCDQLGDEGVQADRGNYPWAANIVTSGQTSCPGWKGQNGQVTNAFQAACPAPFKGTKCLRFEQRVGENPLAATGPRVQFRRSGIVPHAVETWIGWADYWPSHVGWTANSPWPVGSTAPNFIFHQMFETPTNGPILKIDNAPSATFGIRIKADDGAGQPFSTGGLNQNILLASNVWHTFVMRFKRMPIGQQSIIQVWIDKTSSAQAKTIDFTTTTGIGANVENGSSIAWMTCQYNGGPFQFPMYRFTDCHSIARLNQISGDPFSFVHPSNA